MLLKYNLKKHHNTMLVIVCATSIKILKIHSVWMSTFKQACCFHQFSEDSCDIWMSTAKLILPFFKQGHAILCHSFSNSKERFVLLHSFCLCVSSPALHYSALPCNHLLLIPLLSPHTFSLRACVRASMCVHVCTRVTFIIAHFSWWFWQYLLI